LVAGGYPAFLDELRKRGFIDGRNLVVERRATPQDEASHYADATEFARSNVDLILVVGAELAVKAAIAASRTIPIVMWAANFDPIADGYVQSLARPGGNVTGVFTRQPELAAKQVEILKETFPDRIRLAALWDALSADQFAAAERAARALQLQWRPFKLEHPPYDIGSAGGFRRPSGMDNDERCRHARVSGLSQRALAAHPNQNPLVARVVGAFPDGEGVLYLAAARLQHVAGSQRSTPMLAGTRPTYAGRHPTRLARPRESCQKREEIVIPRGDFRMKCFRMNAIVKKK
jgi:ABC transporter substrate binding protein